MPAAGVLARDWTAANALLLYLGENVVMVLLAALTVRIIRPADSRDALRTFFLVAAPFTFGAALFTGAVILIRDEYKVDVQDLLAGLAVMALFQVLSFAFGLRRLRGISLQDSENLLVSVLGRVFLLAFAVWVGLAVAFFFTSAFLVPFIVLKTIVDLGSLRQKSAAAVSL